MSTVTTDQGITIPTGPDSADNPNAFINMIARVESGLVLRYTNLANRAALHTAPVANQITGLAAEGRFDAYDGATYMSLTTRGLHARRMRTTNAANIVSSTVLVSDAVLSVPLDSLGTYRFYGRIYYDAPTTGDIKVAFTFPAVSATGARWGLLGRNAATTSSIEATVATASGTALSAGGLGVGTANTTFLDFDGFVQITATGNLVAQYAQLVSDAGALVVRYGSWMEVTKVGV